MQLQQCDVDELKLQRQEKVLLERTREEYHQTFIPYAAHVIIKHCYSANIGSNMTWLGIEFSNAYADEFSLQMHNVPCIFKEQCGRQATINNRPLLNY